MTENVPGPDFARKATDLLAQGLPMDALHLCRSGVDRFPWYVTGELVLARCLEVNGDLEEARERYRSVQRRLPRSPVAEQHIAALEQKLTPGEETKGESDVEYLLRRLEDAKTQAHVTAPPPGDSSPEGTEPSRATGIVSATLAEIYVNQREYGEAIEAYRRLARQRPAMAARYGKRIAELEALLRQHQGPAAG